MLLNSNYCASSITTREARISLHYLDTAPLCRSGYIHTERDDSLRTLHQISVINRLFLVLTSHPLDPDDVVLVLRRCEILQVVAVVGLDAVGVVAQVLLVCVEQEVLHHVRQLHFLKDGKEDAFADTADPGATVQSTVCAGFTRTLQQEEIHYIILKYHKIQPYLEVYLQDEDRL